MGDIQIRGLGRANEETIAAIATPLGYGSISIIRVSGPKVRMMAKALLGHLPKNRCAEYLSFLSEDNSIIDKGLALYFKAPHSFTGEDVLELQGHGGPVVTNCLLRRVLQLGVRLARPGEFSERAFLNGKLDLVQAEAISDLISSESEHAARAAVRSLEGDFSKRINELREELISLRVWLEASIDFSDEAIDFLENVDLRGRLYAVLAYIREIKDLAKQGVLLQEGLYIAIVGFPNVGKSSLLNRLSIKESAIVTEIPGTTRDVIREKIMIDGLPIHIVDTAGLRTTKNRVEIEGIKRALLEIKKADYILWVVDVNTTVIDSQFLEKIKKFIRNLVGAKRLIFIKNKIDIKGASPCLTQEVGFDVISLSAKTGNGLTLLKHYLKKRFERATPMEGNFSARHRHLEALSRAETVLNKCLNQLSNGLFPELIAEEFTIAQNCLGEITGLYTTNELLGEIFSNFCIGK